MTGSVRPVATVAQERWVLQIVIGVVVLSALTAGTVAAQITPATRGGAIAAAPVTVTARLSRTAVYLGEPTIFTVELRCASGVDVLLEDLQQDRLQVEGGEIVTVDVQHDDGGDSVVRRVHFTLATFNVDATELRLSPMRVRYYARTAGGSANQIAPAGEVTVPGMVVGIRSAIAAWATVPEPRVPAAPRPLPRRTQWASTVGWILMAVAALPLLLLGATSATRGRALWTRFKTARARQQRLSLAEVRLLQPDSDTERIEAFARLDRTIRAHLAHVTGIPADALTPTEVRDALRHSRLGGRRDQLADLLTLCERARYAPTAPSSTEWRTALDDAEQVLGR